MSKRKKSSGPILFGLIVVALATVGYGAGPGKWFEGDEVQALDGVPVRRGDLRISELSRGNLEAKDSEKLTNELEGRATIIHLIEEGTFVEEGDLVCELDVSESRDRRISQEIAVQNGEADFTKAKEQYDIQVIQNESDTAQALLDLKLAELELKKYVEVNGEWTHELAKADEAITVAKEELKQAEDTLKWTLELFEKGFAQRTELEGDELTVEKQRIKVEQATREKSLMELYEHEKRTAELDAAVATAKREVQKVEKQSKAKLADFKAARLSAEFELAREKERLDKIDDQLGKARILAPVAGMVVYGRERSGRMGGTEVPQEGTEVRERQVIATIPKAGGMIADVSLHETKLDQVRAGQRCLVTIDAIPGEVFQGKVAFVAAVADSGSWMSNPNQRLYKTEVALIDTSPDMRPGMSCELEILVEELEDVLYVPRQAVFMDGDRTICFVSGATGPEAVEVETGLNNNSWVVIESGLGEEQVVMLTPPQSWEPAPVTRELTEDPGKPEGFDAAPVGESGGGRPGGGERGGGERGSRGGGMGGGGFADMSAEDRAAAMEKFKNSDVYKNMSEEQKAQMAQRMGGGGGQVSLTNDAGSPSTSGPLTTSYSDVGAEPVAELIDVKRTYTMGSTQVHALDGITFKFQQGEYWAIMGSSGSGKSTLLNILGCIDRPTGGTYRVRGTSVGDLDDDELSELRGSELGFVFQSYNLIPQLNVLENILVPVLYQDDVPEGIEDRAVALAERVGLGERLDHRPTELSGGQQQRVAIARSLINDPALILADEATGNLDSKTAEEILELLDELHAEGKTILLVTHEPVIGKRAEKTLRLKDGRIDEVCDNRSGR